MSVKSVKRKNTVRELLISVGPNSFEAAVEQAYRKSKSKINVTGFRRERRPQVSRPLRTGNVLRGRWSSATHRLGGSSQEREHGTVGRPSVKMEGLSREEV
jgi:hypothetical protein